MAMKRGVSDATASEGTRRCTGESHVCAVAEEGCATDHSNEGGGHHTTIRNQFHVSSRKHRPGKERQAPSPPSCLQQQQPPYNYISSIDHTKDTHPHANTNRFPIHPLTATIARQESHTFIAIPRRVAFKTEPQDEQNKRRCSRARCSKEVSPLWSGPRQGEHCISSPTQVQRQCWCTEASEASQRRQRPHAGQHGGYEHQL